MMEVFSTLDVPGPIPTAISEPFWTALRNHAFVLQRCDDCERWVFYPRAHCPHCWGMRLSWQAASGRGVVKSFSVVHRPGHFAWGPVVPYTIAIIELDEGPTMLSQLLVTNAEHAKVGMRVSLCPVEVGKFVLPFFEEAQEYPAKPGVK